MAHDNSMCFKQSAERIESPIAVHLELTVHRILHRVRVANLERKLRTIADFFFQIPSVKSARQIIRIWHAQNVRRGFCEHLQCVCPCNHLFCQNHLAPAAGLIGLRKTPKIF